MTYGGLLFLSPTLLLLTNSSDTPSLEFWDTASENNFPLGALALPAPSADYTLQRSTFRANASPISTVSARSTRPFYTSPEDDIVTFYVEFRAEVSWTAFSMFVHRGTLLRLCPDHKDPDTLRLLDVIPWETWGPDVTRWVQEPFSYGPGSGLSAVSTSGARAALRKINQDIIVVISTHRALIVPEGNRNTCRRGNSSEFGCRMGRQCSSTQRGVLLWSRAFHTRNRCGQVGKGMSMTVCCWMRSV